MTRLPPSSSSVVAPAAPPATPPTDAAQAAQQDQARAGVARATGVNAVGNIASRVMGLARDVALTNVFGPSLAVDAFNIAIIVPRAIYDLLIGGHVNSALVPVLSEAATEDAAPGARGYRLFWPLVGALAALVAVLTGVIALGLVAAAPWIVALLEGTTAPATTTAGALTVRLLRLTAPALVFMGVFAVFSGALVAQQRFGAPAFAGVVFNASIVVCTLVAARTYGVGAVALGWLGGALAQLLLQMIAMRGARLRPAWAHSAPLVRRIARLYAPVMLSLLIDTLVIRAFSYTLAWRQALEGGVSYMTWATTLIQFPQGLVATAISVAILPTLARQAQHIPAFKDTLGLGLRLATVLILPAAVGLFVLAVPIVALIFEHGAFGPEDTTITVWVLRLYLLGLPFAALDLLLVYAFYAQQDTLTPALVGLLSLGVYLVVTLALAPRAGLFSLMIADSVKHVLHAVVCAVLLWRRLGGLGGQRLAGTALRAGAAATAMGVVGVGLVGPVTAWLPGDALLAETVRVVVLAGACGAVFAAVAWALRVQELRWLVALVRRRMSAA